MELILAFSIFLEWFIYFHYFGEYPFWKIGSNFIMFNVVNLQFDHLIINWITIHILVSVGWVHDWKVCKYVSVDFNLNARNDKKIYYIIATMMFWTFVTIIITSFWQYNILIHAINVQIPQLHSILLIGFLPYFNVHVASSYVVRF